MNRERLTILRDHLASLPDDRVIMAFYFAKNGKQWPTNDASAADILHTCGTAACVAGWAAHLFRDVPGDQADDVATAALDLTDEQASQMFYPPYFDGEDRIAAIAAIQSMLDSPDDDALPVWLEREAA